MHSHTQVYEEPLPLYRQTPCLGESSSFVASTGCEAIDSARRTAQTLVERTATFTHHKVTTKNLADRIDAITFAVIVSALHRRCVSDEALAQVEQLQSLTRELDQLLDEIDNMGATKRNMNRSWTEHRLQALGQRLAGISSALQITDGRANLIEGVFYQPPSPSRRTSVGSPWAASFRAFYAHSSGSSELSSRPGSSASA